MQFQSFIVLRVKVRPPSVFIGSRLLIFTIYSFQNIITITITITVRITVTIIIIMMMMMMTMMMMMIMMMMMMMMMMMIMMMMITLKMNVDHQVLCENVLEYNVITVVCVIFLILSITNFSIVIGSPRAYLTRNRRVIMWVSNYRCSISTFCN